LAAGGEAVLAGRDRGQRRRGLAGRGGLGGDGLVGVVHHDQAAGEQAEHDQAADAGEQRAARAAVLVVRAPADAALRGGLGRAAVAGAVLAVVGAGRGTAVLTATAT